MRFLDALFEFMIYDKVIILNDTRCMMQMSGFGFHPVGVFLGTI